MNIKLRVANLVKKYGTADPFKLAKDLDILVLELSIPSNIRGFFVRALRQKIIILNDELCYEAQKITIAHELGHSRLHNGYGYFFSTETSYIASNTCEMEANEYAAHLLSYSTDVEPEMISRFLSEKHPTREDIRHLLEFISA